MEGVEEIYMTGIIFNVKIWYFLYFSAEPVLFPTVCSLLSASLLILMNATCFRVERFISQCVTPA